MENYKTLTKKEGEKVIKIVEKEKLSPYVMGSVLDNHVTKYFIDGEFYKVTTGIANGNVIRTEILILDE